MPDAQALAAAVTSGVAALHKGDITTAIALLGPVASDPDLAAAADLVDVRARILVLYGQALVGAEDVKGAEPVLIEALKLTKKLDDDEGIAAVRGLQQALNAVRTKHRKGPAPRRDPGAADAPETPARLVAEAEAARGPDAVRLAERALSLSVDAGAVREEVLARLVIAREDASRAADQLTAALRRARGANEFTLVGAVVRAAELHRVELPKEPYAGRPTE